MSHDEGVIKFRADHRYAPIDADRLGDALCALVAWREIFGRLGLVGQDPARYGGYGFGNVSARIGRRSAPRHKRPFLITGTQTSGKACVDAADFCLVETCDPVRNAVTSHGQVMPSSESLTHGAIYDLAPHIRFVFHAHSPAIWHQARTLRLPTSDPAVPYGTQAMAREVARLYRETALGSGQILAMGGHEDGVVCFGRDAEEAGQVLLRTLARSYEHTCANAGGLCRA